MAQPNRASEASGPDVYQQYYKVLRNCFLLIVEGTIQKQSGILNVLAEGALGI